MFLVIIPLHCTLLDPASPQSKVGVPYVRAKAHDYYESLGGGNDPDLMDTGTGMRQLRALTDQVDLDLILLSVHH